jgi:hypothetical protein
MTTAKRNRGRSEKRVHSYCSATSKGKKPHSAMSVLEIREVFFMAGWIGISRDIPVLRQVNGR